MVDELMEYVRKDCLFWSIRIMPSKIYYKILCKFTVNLSPNVYPLIKEGYLDWIGAYWSWVWLNFEIKKETLVYNIYTGKIITEEYFEIMGTFHSRCEYEEFQKNLMDATESYLKKESMEGDVLTIIKNRIHLT